MQRSRIKRSRVGWCARPSLWRVILAAGFLFALSAGGCGPRLPAGKVRVTGTVTYQSQPPAAYGIGFVAKQGTESMTAAVGADGRFAVVLTPGEYTAWVLDKLKQMDENGNVIVAPSLIPAKYTSPSTSGLDVVVTKDAKPLSIALER
jgi:hypothetical protein